MNNRLEDKINKRIKSTARLEAVVYMMFYCMTVFAFLIISASAGNIIFFRWLEIATIYPSDVAGILIGISITRGFIPFGLAKRMRANHKAESDRYAANLWRSARSHPAYYR